MAGYEVDPESVAGIVEALQVASQGIRDDLHALRGAFDVLLTLWTGDAADAFAAAQARWFGLMAQKQSELDAITAMLSAALDRYELTESTVIQACA